MKGLRLTKEQYAAIQARGRPRPKYWNIKTTIDGITFDSAKEARKYQELIMLERAGKIANLKMQVPFTLEVNGRLIGKYICDFTWLDKHENLVVCDVKSKATRTAVYMLKKRLMLACYNIRIVEA